ncbi:50S ribosomal protein L3 [Sodalis-like secondary symbiont of Drepanosiphum platanoidis]|uniref:50S ribosomal protein L3 n=1 Tax=Sodalis-like secondary symbiont of Drepanosiphum platanoidis TaxID=2994493 RepID=UPI0034642771
MKCIIGKKIGMTRIFTKDGISIPVTVIKIQPNFITQIKNSKKNSYYSIQVTTGTKKFNHINKPESGHFLKSGVQVGNTLCEFNLLSKNKKLNIGDSFNIDILSNIKKVDITSISKGKGFSGTVKRWNFKTQDATHGNSLSHRAPGSIGQNQTPGRVFKGKKMSGQLGNEKVTIQNLNIIKLDKKNELLLIKGSIPGISGSQLIIKASIKM